MLKVGVTGGIGSGKTTVCQVFKALGISVYNADIEAKNLMLSEAVKLPLIEKFGTETYHKDGSLNRAHLSSIVFNDKGKLAYLNSIVHPAVFKHFDDWVLAHNNEPYIIKEAALMFESESYKSLDKVITVSAPKELRIQRVLSRDDVSKEDIEKRIANQFSEEKRQELADYIIYNDDNQLVIPQIMELHETFLKS